MITNLNIKNFKCFFDESILFRPMTVLSGINGMGKSSVMQSMLLLRQSALKSASISGAYLNGPLVNLGYADDVLYDGPQGNDAITFTLTDDKNCEEIFSFSYRKGDRILESRGDYSSFDKSVLFGENFSYLTAERIGPRTAFDSLNTDNDRYNPIGNAGEYCAWLLAENERKPIGSDALLHHNEPLNELRSQVEAWLSEIGQNLRIHLDSHHAMDKVSLQFSFIRDGVPTNNYRPTNVGFGITYTLPIFVAGLLAKPGGILLIENPEAHLHPKGQSAMGMFLSRIAATGVQVIVETHSDHLLNGIRLATKNRLINPSNVALHFFYRKLESQATSLVTPTLDLNGRLDQWPEGFFDEWENNLANLL